MILCNTDWMSQNHVLASCRTVLRTQGILGLSRAPCMAVFLERLPVLLHEQYSYERVGTTCLPHCTIGTGVSLTLQDSWI